MTAPRWSADDGLRADALPSTAEAGPAGRVPQPGARWSRTRRLVCSLTVLALGCGLAPAQEVQIHGLIFEQWVRNTFFEGYKPASYTQRWDIPAEINKLHGDVPVNPKAVKYGTSIDLGDALRQYEIQQPFMLVVGFWKQEGDEKRIVNIAAPVISPSQWRRLWGPVTYDDLLRLHTLIKSQDRPVDETRRLAVQMKNAPPFNQAVIQMNPKVGSDGQRRLQCSLRFADFFKLVAADFDRKVQEHPSLFGVEFPGTIPSKPRGKE